MDKTMGFLPENLPKFSELNTLKLCVNLMEALDYMHSEGVYNGDLKPSNVLIDDMLNAKFGDLGSSIDFSENDSMKYKIKLATLNYCKPEIYEKF